MIKCHKSWKSGGVVKRIEKIFGGIAVEIDRSAPWKWEECVTDIEFGEKTNVNCYYIKNNKKEIKYVAGSKIIRDYFNDYNNIVLQNEGKKLSTATFILTISGHTDFEYSYDKAEIEVPAERIKQLGAL